MKTHNSDDNWPLACFKDFLDKVRRQANVQLNNKRFFNRPCTILPTHELWIIVNSKLQCAAQKLYNNGTIPEATKWKSHEITSFSLFSGFQDAG